MQAAFLRVKLTRLDEWNTRRRVVAGHYLKELSETAGLLLPVVPAWAEPVWHLFVVRHQRRDDLRQKLKEAGIGTVIHYPVPPHCQKAYGDLDYKRGSFPISEQLAEEVLSLPMGPHLTRTEQDVVISDLLKYCRVI
jgi:dTDP-4-amino-4,6-dideoxygalactose transaminase